MEYGRLRGGVEELGVLGGLYFGGECSSWVRRVMKSAGCGWVALPGVGGEKMKHGRKEKVNYVCKYGNNGLDGCVYSIRIVIVLTKDLSGRYEVTIATGINTSKEDPTVVISAQWVTQLIREGGTCKLMEGKKGVNTPRSDKDRLKLNELMEFCMKDLENTKTEVTIKDVNLSVNEVTLAQALAALKSAKVQEKTNVVEEPNIETELVEGSKVRAEAEIAQESSSKRAGTELEQESIKKQKVDKDKETAKLQRLIEVVLDKEEVAIDAIPYLSQQQQEGG
ncbi:hypothetical protein Tco_0321937 [Tanacetum coccineum]